VTHNSVDEHYQHMKILENLSKAHLDNHLFRQCMHISCATHAGSATVPLSGNDASKQLFRTQPPQPLLDSLRSMAASVIALQEQGWQPEQCPPCTADALTVESLQLYMHHRLLRQRGNASHTRKPLRLQLHHSRQKKRPITEPLARAKAPTTATAPGSGQILVQWPK
jgi:hypothetical protein